MPRRYVIELSEEERAKLESWVKNAPKPHLRQRARAIVLVAEGKPLYKVAEDRRIRKDRKTVQRWVQRDQSEGIEGLKTKKGQGRKAAFSPSEQGGSARGA
jgi:transposase